MSSHFFSLVVIISLPFVISIVPPVSFEESELEYHVRQKRDISSLEERESCQPFRTKPATRSNTTEQLWKLRQKMRDNDYSAYIIPTNDEHQSEYVANYDKRRQYISGFTGSAGTAVVLLDSAALWTDGRYFLQAEEELDCNWILMKKNEKGTPKISEWLIDNLSNRSKVGADPRLISQKWWLKTEEELNKSNIILVAEYKNLIDEIWTEADGRDPQPTGKIFIHDLTYAGKHWNTKIEELKKELEDKKANSIIVTALDEVAWLFNLRGSDVPHCPVFKSFAFVSQDQIRLYIDPVKLTDEVIHHLTENGNSSYLLQFKNYSDVYNDVSELITSNNKILISSKSSYAFYNLIPEENRIVSDSPIVLMKAVKNPIEIEGMKKANIRDSVAIIDFIAMLEEEVKAGKHWDEMKASETLAELRKQQELNMGESFEAISASGPNGAVIHHSPKPATNRVIDTKNMYLLDTGGQYLDGTTDTTRTFHFGLPTDYEKETYTRVLMGVIDLASAVFPEGVRDVDVDVFARRHLYEIGLNYLHGTGHGIGSFLNVHEGPTRVREAKTTSTESKFEPGMFFSDEPGFYENGKFGIRLETVLTVVKADTEYNFNNETYYKFEPVAFVPFEPKLIKLNLLDKYQIKWLNDYNLKIRQIIGEELHSQNKLRAYDWMMSRTTYIETLTCNS